MNNFEELGKLFLMVMFCYAHPGSIYKRISKNVYNIFLDLYNQLITNLNDRNLSL